VISYPLLCESLNKAWLWPSRAGNSAHQSFDSPDDFVIEFIGMPHRDAEAWRIDPTVIGQKHDISRSPEPTVAISLGKGRDTSGLSDSKLCLSFVDGLCAGRTGLIVTKQRTTVGRGEDCDIILDGETVSRLHCEIVRWGAVYVLIDGSRNGSFVNGERVSQAQLRDGDQIRVGQNILLVHFSSASKTSLITTKSTTPHRLPPAIELKPHIVVKGLEEGVTQPFGDDRITVGRRSDNHLVLESDNISRHHFSIERRNGEYFVCDLGSANGTFLNDERINSTRLRDGDRLRIGNFIITVSLPDEDCVLNFKQNTR
jgi:pSer/pThr/pTyr-binding forkhead associated (FHA) protein